MTGNKGYTFIELIVVVMMLGLLMLGVTQLFFAALKGTSKANAIARVKEYGSHVQISVERMIRNGASVISCNEERLVIEDTNGGSDELEFVEGDLLLNQESLISEDVRIVNFSCTNEFIEANESDKVNLQYTIQFGDAGSNRPEDILSQDYFISVQLRNN